jgi:predicted metalloendopeptidase
VFPHILHPVRVDADCRPANGWRKDHPLSSDQGRRSIGSELDKKNRGVVKAILESNDVPLGSHYDTQVIGKLRRLYASCMDEQKLDELASEPLLSFTTALRKLFDGKRNTPAHAELTEALSLLHSRGTPSLSCALRWVLIFHVGKASTLSSIPTSRAMLGLTPMT